MDISRLFKTNERLPDVLTKREVYSLFKRMKKGEVGAREKIIEANIRLVIYLVGEMFIDNPNLEDLVSIGNIGLIKAVDSFDITKNYEFATYASYCIRNEILIFLKRDKRHQGLDSIDRVISTDLDGADTKVVDTLHAKTDILGKYAERESYEIIRLVVATLPSKDREIAILYFGFFNVPRMGQKEIGAKFGVSQSYISRVIKRVIGEIQNNLELMGTIEVRGSDLEKNTLEEQILVKDINQIAKRIEMARRFNKKLSLLVDISLKERVVCLLDFGFSEGINFTAIEIAEVLGINYLVITKIVSEYLDSKLNNLVKEESKVLYK